MTATPPARLLPDSALLTMDALRAAGIYVVDEMPAAGDMYYPLVYVRRIPGSGPVHAEFLDEASMSVLVFAQDRTEALDLAASCSVALYRAWQKQAPFPHGSIASFTDTSGAFALPTTPGVTPDGEVVVQSTFRLGLCPPPS